jgi:ElaB/YqjD/DUF883 family membrane-anchored ribosome-binding protein
MDRNMTHLTEEQLVLHYYGDSEDVSQVETHLAQCPTCNAEYASLQRLLNSVDSVPVPERGAGYGEQVWLRVQGELGLSAKRSWWNRLSGNWSAMVPRWAVAGGGMVLLALAFLAGRWTVQPSIPQSQTVAARAGSERVLLDALGEHLDRTQMTLVSLANSSGDETRLERGQAEDLLKENRLYRQAALRSGDQSAAAVLDELERVLVEVANAPEGELDSVRQRMIEQGLLFKIRVLRSQVIQKEKAGRPDLMLRN